MYIFGGLEGQQGVVRIGMTRAGWIAPLWVSLCRGNVYAPGVSDYFHPYEHAGDISHAAACGSSSPKDMHAAPVVICSELPNNPGGSITNSAEVLAAGMTRANELPTSLALIEPRPKKSTEGQETFDLVVFSGYKVEERAPDLGERRAWIGDATWKPLDCATVEVLVGGKVN